MGRELQLHDFSKTEMQRQKEQASYEYLYSDTLTVLRKVMTRVGSEKHLDCFMVALKLLTKILKHSTAELRDSCINIYVECLCAISQQAGFLNPIEKERFYSAVKRLIKIIKEQKARGK